ncbi:LacI family DNA-binding transcriptional regulator [Thermobifida halotolerans]|uniref:LacI family DNA-binding transcriptional regulator n=1 Tax=Thermobifida halotolerans TaxID=483545 RepID=UPI001F3C1835|nr:LacI family DNA-binding transcriptional regulator [Thermobifida halotolerans]
MAVRAGVGIKTVSRVLNDEPNVRPQTRERVLAAVGELNYRRNTIASSIRRRDQRTASIGLVVEDLANPFAARLTRVVQDVAFQQSHLVLVGSSEGVAEREHEIVGEFCSRRVDGLIIVPSGTDQSYLRVEHTHGAPVVFVDRPGRRIKADTVVSENASGVAEAVRHLVRHGHSRIAYLGDRQSVYTAAQRLSGFRSAMAECAGGADQRHIRTGLRDGAKAYQATLDLLGQRPAPTALVCGNNIITMGALHAMQQCGVREHVAIIGFDDLELADLLQPALTVVAQDVAALGTEGARLLFERLKHPTAPYRRVTVPVRLIARGSGEIPAPSGREGR